MKLFKLKNILFLCFLFTFFSCSNEIQKNSINLSFPENIVQVDGFHSFFIDKSKIIVKNNIISDDCDSWKVKYDFESLFIKSYNDLIERMFEKHDLKSFKLSDNDPQKDSYASYIEFSENQAILDFITERNTGKFNIKLTSIINVKSNNMVIENSVMSEQNWEKNIYLNCDLQKGSKKVIEKAFKNLIEQAHQNIYKSIKKITR